VHVARCLHRRNGVRPPTRGSSSPVPCPLVVFPADYSPPPLRRPSHPCVLLYGLFRAQPIGFVGLGCALTAIYGRCHLGLPNSSFLTSLFSRLAGLAVVIRSVIGGGEGSLQRGRHADVDEGAPGPRPGDGRPPHGPRSTPTRRARCVPACEVKI